MLIAISSFVIIFIIQLLTRRSKQTDNHRMAVDDPSIQHIQGQWETRVAKWGKSSIVAALGNFRSSAQVSCRFMARSRLTRLYSHLVFDKPLLVIGLLGLVVAVSAGIPNTSGWMPRRIPCCGKRSGSGVFPRNQPTLPGTGLGNRRLHPVADLSDPAELARLGRLRQDLLAIEWVESVDSILNVPIFADTPLTGISENYLTLLDTETDLAAARQEIINSPVFRNALLSPDGQTAGMQVSFALDQTASALLSRRTELRKLAAATAGNPEELQELARVEAEYADYSVQAAERRHRIIGDIRATLDNYRDAAQIYLGGAPMIADDLVSFVQGDLSNFSIAVVLLIIIALGLIFRRLRWVALPLLCCAAAGTIMVGLLGLMDWRVTVVSSISFPCC